MPWRQKDHYSFSETADRWHLSLRDITYLAERRKLEVQTWLSDVVVARYALMKIEGGDLAPVQIGLVSLTGYFVVDPDELRKVFRATQQVAEIRKFISLDGNDLYSIPYNNVGPSVGIGALEISMRERDRFEIEHKLKPRVANMNKTGLQSSSVGRPSARDLIIERFDERAAKGEIESHLFAEARYLHAWAQDELGPDDAPAFKTIVNNLRPHFAAYKGEERS